MSWFIALAAAKCQTRLMESLHSPIRAALWMGASIACFIVMSVAGRVATAELDVFQVMLIRSVIGFFMLLPLVHLAGGLRAMGTARPWQHIGRNAAHFAGQFAWLLALGMIPLAQLVAIEFTQPFWTALLALLVLGERMTWRKVCALLFGIAGVLVIVRPGSGPIEPGHLVMLAGAVFFGVSVVMVKLLTRSDSVVKIIFWMLVIQTAIGIVPGLWVWQPVPVEIWPALLVVAFTGTFSHYCMARALVHAEATVVVPMDFLRVPLMALVGWAMYAEQLDIYTGTGALLILLGNLFTIRFRRRKSLSAEAP